MDTFQEKYLKVPVIEHPNTVIQSIPDPLVSVWVVTYNQRSYFRQTIGSVLDQVTDFPFEIILGDDESDDGTRELCLEYADRYPGKIRLFLHSRANNIKIPGDCPNPNFQGIYNWFQCRGKYIATLEGDDFWIDPGKLQKQADFLEANPDYSGVCTNFNECDPDGSIIRERKYSKIRYPDFSLHYILKFHTITRTLTCMYRNYPETRTEIGSMAAAPFLDRTILTLMAQRGPIRCLEDVTATFRQGSGYFSPVRKLVGRLQRVSQWEIMAEHYRNSEWYLTTLAELHSARVNWLGKLSAFQKWRYLLRQLLPISQDLHFSWKWYLLLAFFRPEEIPMALYAAKEPANNQGRFFDEVKP